MSVASHYYPEQVNIYCLECEAETDDVPVDSIEGEYVAVTCPECKESHHERVIFD